MSADFSRTCAGCDQIVTEPWAKGKTGYRCGATGPRRGYTVGIERFFPVYPGVVSETHTGTRAEIKRRSYRWTELAKGFDSWETCKRR